MGELAYSISQQLGKVEVHQVIWVGLEGGRNLQKVTQSSLAGVLDLEAVDAHSQDYTELRELCTGEFLEILVRAVTFSSGVTISTLGFSFMMHE